MQAWFEAALWHKRLVKLGTQLSASNITREKTMELMPEFAKVNIAPSVLKQYCDDMQVDADAVLLNYAIELCRSSSVVREPQRFAGIIQTATAALRVGSLIDRPIDQAIN